MKYIHIVQFHLMSGGGVGSVITDVSEAMAQCGKEVHVISLFENENVNFQKSLIWAKDHGIKVHLIQKQGMSVFNILLALRKLLKDLSSKDSCCLYMHLKWGVLAGVLSSVSLKNVYRIEVYHSGYINYALQATICKPFIHKYIAVSKEAKQQLIEQFGIKPSKIQVIYNGVDIDTIRNAAIVTRKTDNRLIFTSIGRLSYEKGFDYPISAYGQLRDEGKLEKTSYIMVGDGDDTIKCKTLSNGYVDFIGMIPRNEVYGYIANADVMILPSLWEGNSIMLLEILAVGKAVIVTDIPSFREVLGFEPLKLNENYRMEAFGFIVQKENREAFEHVMQSIEMNRNKLNQMSNYVGLFGDKYSTKIQAEKYIEIII